jgi:glycosyltransferase involved in cell wall biosynthesis
VKILLLTLADVDDRSYGGALRSAHIRNALARSGDVDTLVIHGAPDFRMDTAWDHRRSKTATFNLFTPSLAWLRQRRAIRRWVERAEAEGRYDVIVARYLGLALFLPASAWSRLVLDADDIFKSAPAGAPSRVLRLKYRLRNLVARVALRLPRHVWFVNPRDDVKVRRQRSSWLPNIVRAPDAAGGAARVADRVLMVGFFDHRPNAEGLRWFCERVLPALVRGFPGARLHAVGAHSAELAADLAGKVHFAGFVEDLASEYARASLVIAPVGSGGGTQIKVIDALAHARPLVASPFAHAGFAGHLKSGEHLLVAADEGRWIEHCSWVFEHQEKAQAMAEKGRDIVRQHFGPERMFAEVKRTLDEVLERG